MRCTPQLQHLKEGRKGERGRERDGGGWGWGREREREREREIHNDPPLINVNTNLSLLSIFVPVSEPLAYEILHGQRSGSAHWHQEDQTSCLPPKY